MKVIFGAAAVLVGLAFLAGDGQSQQPGPKAKAAAKHAARIANDERLLVQAWVSLEAAQHDFGGGHQHHAEIQLIEAIAMLNGAAVHEHTGRRVAADEKAVEGFRSEFRQKHPNVEGRELARLHLEHARELLAKADEALARQHRPRVHHHVEEARKEIGAALHRSR